MSYQLEKATEEEIKQYAQSLRGLPGGRTEVSEYLDEIPSELGEETLWTQYSEDEYDEEELLMDKESFFELVSELEELPEEKGRLGFLSRYEEGFQNGVETAEEDIEYLESWMSDIESWRNINQHWLDATEANLDSIWNPFELKRREIELSDRQGYNQQLEGNNLKQIKLDNKLKDINLKEGNTAAKIHFSGVTGFLAGIVAGSASGEMAAGFGGGLGLLTAIRAKSIRDLSYLRGYKDGIKSERSEYRVEEMKDNIGELTIDLKKTPETDLWDDEDISS